MIATRTPAGEPPIDPTILFKFYNRMETSRVAIKLFEKLTVQFGDEIISSPHNTDARYVKKRRQSTCGQKRFLTETCDTANKTQFLTDTEVTPATTPDAKELPGIQERLEEAEMKPKEYYADAGFVNGQTIGDSHTRGVVLEDPSAGHSQSFKKFQAEDRPLGVADFEIMMEGGRPGSNRTYLSRTTPSDRPNTQ